MIANPCHPLPSLLQEKPDLYSTMRTVVDDCLARSTWQWLDTVDEFLQGRGVKFIALVTQRQKEQQVGCLEKRFVLGRWFDFGRVFGFWAVLFGLECRACYNKPHKSNQC